MIQIYFLSWNLPPSSGPKQFCFIFWPSDFQTVHPFCLPRRLLSIVFVMCWRERYLLQQKRNPTISIKRVAYLWKVPTVSSSQETLNLALVNVPSVKVKERGWISDGVFAASSPFSSSSVLCCVDSGSSEGVRGYKMLPDMISPPNRFWRFTTAVGSSDTRPRPPFCSLSTRISLILCPHVFLASVRGA